MPQSLHIATVDLASMYTQLPPQTHHHSSTPAGLHPRSPALPALAVAAQQLKQLMRTADAPLTDLLRVVGGVQAGMCRAQAALQQWVGEDLLGGAIVLVPGLPGALESLYTCA